MTAKTVTVATALGGKLPPFLDRLSGAGGDDAMLRWHLQLNQTDAKSEAVIPPEDQERLNAPLINDQPQATA